jgi:octaprenyl-diphosphate synthase
VSDSKLEAYLRSFQRDQQLHSFQEPIHKDLERMQGILREFFHSRIPLIQRIGDHLLEMAGKRFRPALTLLIARLEGEPSKDPVFAATVIELIHTATLVHDDTIDKSAMRRGLPTINSLYNDLVSTILGDYIYTKSLVELTERGEHRIMEVVTRTTYQMSIGEMLQIQQKQNPTPTEEDYLELVDAKTASLMSASCEVGALVAGFDEKRVESLRLFGVELGRAYQITDDVFDYIGDSGALGKYGKSDLAEGKVTLPLILALDRCKEDERARVHEILGKDAVTPDDWSFVIELLQTHGALEECRSRALASAERALKQLEGIRPSVFLDGLRQAVDYAVTRSH